MVGVGILSFNDAEMLAKCVVSLKDKAGVPISVVVWDNASIDKNVPYLIEKHPDVRILPQSVNLGCTISRNAMIVHFHRYFPEIKHVLLTDMDVEFTTQGFLQKMVDVMDKYKDCGMVAYPKANVGFPISPDGIVSEVMSICTLYRLEMFLDTGLIDNRFFYYSFDSEFAQRANSFGWHVYLVNDGSEGYSHVHGHCHRHLSDVREIMQNDSDIWCHRLAKLYNNGKPWDWQEDKK